MAFVFKSERMWNIIKTQTENIGPGEYLPQTEVKQVKINKKPFLSGTKRNSTQKNDFPGPGAYYQDKTLINYLKNIQNEKIAEQNDKILLLSKGKNIVLQGNAEKLGFSIKEKRFKINNETNFPGPGFYFVKNIIGKKKSSIKSAENPIEINNKLKKIRRQEFLLIPSIPAKNQMFGFDITEKGDLIQKKDPDMYKVFRGEKGDCVGPGNYEIEKPNHWLKTGTEWSKFKTTRDSNGKKKENEKNINECLSMSTTRYSDSLGKSWFFFGNRFYNNNKDNLSKTMYSLKNNFNISKVNDNNNVKILNKNIMNSRIVKIKENNKKNGIRKDIFENIIKRNEPGPGYYYNQNTFLGFKTQEFPEYKQFFGSKVERFGKIKVNSFVGPGSYFINDNKKNIDNNVNNSSNSKQSFIFKGKMSSTIENFVPFNLGEERFSKSQGQKGDIPGPGQYKIRGIFSANKIKIRKIYKRLNNFGSSEKRFPDRGNTKLEYETPGADSYLKKHSKLEKLMLFSNTNNLYRSRYISHVKKDNKKILIKKRKSDSVPPVGLYHPEMIYTIDYNNKKKITQSREIEGVAFESRVNRKSLKKSQTGNNIGPGYYFNEKVIKNLQKYPPFNQSCKKRNKDSSDIMINGPGQNNIDSYYDWNKKTFNITFI